MKNRILFLTALLLFFLPLFSFPVPGQKIPKDLAPAYKKWLQEEVVYIITPKEKEVFLQLETDRERNLFIESFWKHRDPNLNTPENEFQDEHYRRIKYANQYFGKEGPGAGWRSAMGRIYIILGEPGYIERYDNLSEVYPTIIWSYSAMPELGLLQAFNVVFFRRGGDREYELYSPVRFGPQYLLVHYKGDQSDYMAAYNELFDVEPTLAYNSLTLLPGERTLISSPSLASEILINATIPSAPHKKIEDSWAERLLAYKDVVEVEYSANYIDSDSYMKVMEDDSGIYFAHYLIEPSRLTFEQYEGRFLTNLEINGNVSDLEGNAVFQYERTIPIEFNEEQMNSIRNKLFSFQDMIPLVEGEYTLSLLFKNRVSKEFTSAEKHISIPKSSDALRISALILANRAVTDSQYRGKSKPFLFDNIQFVPSPRNDFSREDHLYLFFQIRGLTDDLKETGILEYSISTADTKVQSFRQKIKDYPHAPSFFEDIPLSSLSPAYYRIKVSLFDKDQKEFLFEEADFYISHALSLPRPWLLSLPEESSAENPIYLNILGNQYLNKKDHAKARQLFEEAYRTNPESAKFALDFCRSLFNLKDYQKVKEIAQPFLDRPEKHEFHAILGQSCQMLGELAEAISHYKSYLAYHGTHIPILNAIGDCYYQLGNKEEALTSWEKSLELNPNQESLKKRVESLKEKK